MKAKSLNSLIVKSETGSSDSSIQPFNHSTISIANRQRTRKVNLRLLEQITAHLLAELEIENAELQINMVAAPEMARLNETFLGHKGSTDVITFDYSNTECGARSVERNFQSEIFICVDEAVSQAKKFRTTWQAEIVRYIVHGVLHLLGHDDSRLTDRRKMKREEDRRLRALSRRFSVHL